MWNRKLVITLNGNELVKNFPDDKFLTEIPKEFKFEVAEDGTMKLVQALNREEK